MTNQEILKLADRAGVPYVVRRPYVPSGEVTTIQHFARLKELVMTTTSNLPQYCYIGVEYCHHVGL
jgi:hypothetical protein